MNDTPEFEKTPHDRLLPQVEVFIVPPYLKEVMGKLGYYYIEGNVLSTTEQQLLDRIPFEERVCLGKYLLPYDLYCKYHLNGGTVLGQIFNECLVPNYRTVTSATVKAVTSAVQQAQNAAPLTIKEKEPAMDRKQIVTQLMVSLGVTVKDRIDNTRAAVFQEEYGIELGATHQVGTCPTKLIFRREVAGAYNFLYISDTHAYEHQVSNELLGVRVKSSKYPLTMTFSEIESLSKRLPPADHEGLDIRVLPETVVVGYAGKNGESVEYFGLGKNGYSTVSLNYTYDDAGILHWDSMELGHLHPEDIG